MSNWAYKGVNPLTKFESYFFLFCLRKDTLPPKFCREVLKESLTIMTRVHVDYFPLERV